MKILLLLIKVFYYSKEMIVAHFMDNIRIRNAYLSLSPLVIDQSVYAEKTTQTPEIFYYTGYEKPEIPNDNTDMRNTRMNWLLLVRRILIPIKISRCLTQNNNNPGWNELFEQLEDVFKPLKNKTMSQARSPFKFLDSYQQADADVFFGREKETNDLYNALSGVKHCWFTGHRAREKPA